MIKGIDISEWQSGFDLQSAFSAGYNFAILRGGFTGYGASRSKNKDECFDDFYKQAKNIRMPVGVYWYSCADSAEQGKAEAEFLYENCLKGRQFEYPIYIDVEDGHWQQDDKDGVTDAIIAFCDYLQDKGYFVGVYASLYWFNTYIDTDRLDDYTKWVACWDDEKPDFDYNAFDMWQYSSECPIDGFRIDGDIAYSDFPSIIKSIGLNGYAAQDPAPVQPQPEKPQTSAIDDLAQKTADLLHSAGEDYGKVKDQAHRKLINQVANDVIAGKWGSGLDRKKRLTNAGFDYDEVQNRVNAILD